MSNKITKKRNKVSSSYQRRSLSKDVFVPKIILQGLWLRKIGIDIGDHVNIEFTKNQIIITKY